MNNIFILISHIAFVICEKTAQWDYERNVEGYLSPEDWYKGYPECAGLEQSPINIDHDNTIYDWELQKILVNYKNPYDSEDSDNMVWSMHNNGHTGFFLK